jgi:hypothetical protein
MNLDQIRESVDAGRTVFWRHKSYRVVKSPTADAYLVCHNNGQCFSITGPDGKTLLCNEVDFSLN